MKHQKQDMNKHEKHKHDYYVNSHVIRPMLNMIAKTNGENTKYGSI